MPRKLEVEILADASQLQKTMGRAATQSESFGKRFFKAGLALGGGFFAVQEAAHLASEAITSVVHSTLDAQAVNARLAVSFKNAGLSLKTYSDAIDRAEKSGRRLGFTDDEIKTSLGSLVTATKNVTTSVKDLKVVQDAARFTGKSLTDATRLVTMAMTGSQRAAKALGISVQPVTSHFDALAKGATKAQKAHAKFLDKISTGNAVIDALKVHVKGQAEAFSKTLPGAIAEARAWLNHLEIEIGTKMIPIIQKAVAWIRANWPQISAVIKQGWADIKPVLSALGSLVIGVVAIIRSHWAQIGPIVHAVAAIIKTELKIIGDAIKLVADLLQGRWGAAWKTAKDLASNLVQAIKNEVRLAFVIVRGVIQTVINALSALWGWFSKKVPIPSFGGLIGALESVINTVKDLVHWTSVALSNLLGIGGAHQSRGKARGAGGPSGVLPKGGGNRGGASGAIVTRPTWAMIGERGPEALLPLSGARGASSLPSGPIQVNLNLDGKTLARVLIDPLRGQARIFEHQNGRPAF